MLMQGMLGRKMGGNGTSFGGYWLVGHQAYHILTRWLSWEFNLDVADGTASREGLHMGGGVKGSLSRAHGTSECTKKT